MARLNIMFCLMFGKAALNSRLEFANSSAFVEIFLKAQIVEIDG